MFRLNSTFFDRRNQEAINFGADPKTQRSRQARRELLSEKNTPPILHVQINVLYLHYLEPKM